VAFTKALGQPAEPFQRRILAALHGPEREVVVILPRGNAKTTIGGRAALQHLVANPTASVALGSGTREQASIAFEIMAADAEHPALDGAVDVRVHAMRAQRGGRLRVVSGRGHRAHGRTDSVHLLDELWAQDGSLLEAFETALIKRADARLWIISTAAPTLDSPLGRLRLRALALPNAHRDGPVLTASGDGLRWLEWSLPDDEDPNDLDAVTACNPASWITHEALEEQRHRVTPPAWLTFHCCRWGVGMASWLPPGAWSAARDDAITLGRDEPLYLAVDIGGVRAASALVGVTADLRVAHVEVFQGEDAVLEVTEAIERLIRSGQAIAELVFDEWRYYAEALRLEREYRLRTVTFPQKQERLVKAAEALHAAVIDGRLRHPGHPDLDRHVHAAVAKQTGRGFRLALAPNAEPEVQIDAAIALAMAVSHATAPPPTPGRYYGTV
jgi:phage terminase large subunit-like protein